MQEYKFWVGWSGVQKVQGLICFIALKYRGCMFINALRADSYALGLHYIVKFDESNKNYTFLLKVIILLITVKRFRIRPTFLHLFYLSLWKGSPDTYSTFVLVYIQ